MTPGEPLTTVAGELLDAAWRSLRSVQPGTWIALAGWIVTGAGWYVSQQSQRRSFLYQAMNAARAEIVEALRKQQSNVGDLSVIVLTTSTAHDLGQASSWPETKWLELFERYRATWADSHPDWIFVLEEYEVLFPETARCREQLVERNRRVRDDVGAFFVDVLTPNTRGPALMRANHLFGSLTDEVALIEDLLVHVQNATLGKVVGKSRAFRQPPDPRVPRILNRNGQLEVVEGVTA